jgi:hypothetical protein
VQFWAFIFCKSGGNFKNGGEMGESERLVRLDIAAKKDELLCKKLIY